MSARLSSAQEAALRELAAGKRSVLQARNRTLQSLYVRGLVESYGYSSGYYTGWRLTKHGRLALRTGRTHLTRREP